MDRGIAKLRVRPEGVEDFIKGVLELSVPTRAEKGCLGYELYRSDDDPCDFYFVEHWATEEDFRRHMGSAHVAEFEKTVEKVAAAPVEPMRWHRVL